MKPLPQPAVIRCGDCRGELRFADVNRVDGGDMTCASCGRTWKPKSATSATFKPPAQLQQLQLPE